MNTGFTALRRLVVGGLGLILIAIVAEPPLQVGIAQNQPARKQIALPSSKFLLEPVPGMPRPTNSFPVTMALDPTGRFLAILNNGFGTRESQFQQSIAMLDLEKNQLRDFPDRRFYVNAAQTYFYGLAFSTDGARLYASVGSITDPAGQRPGHLGNGIAVYEFRDGAVAPQGFLKIPLQSAPAGKEQNPALASLPQGKCIPYPAGLAVVRGVHGDEIVVADNLSDNALLMDPASGQILHVFDLTTSNHIPASYPYAVVATRDGARAYCSLWNASDVAELDLRSGQVLRRIPLFKSSSPIGAGSHPTALLLSRDEKRLYVALANADAVAVIDSARGQLIGLLSTLLPGQDYAGTYPSGLAETADGKRLLVVDSGADAIAVFDTSSDNLPIPHPALGFVPTEWYPTAVAVRGDDLLIASGKGVGSGPNSGVEKGYAPESLPGMHPYVVSMLHGSIARLSLRRAESELASFTEEVQRSNLMQNRDFKMPFAGGAKPHQACDLYTQGEPEL